MQAELSFEDFKDYLMPVVVIMTGEGVHGNDVVGIAANKLNDINQEYTAYVDVSFDTFSDFSHETEYHNFKRCWPEKTMKNSKELLADFFEWAAEVEPVGNKIMVGNQAPLNNMFLRTLGDKFGLKWPMQYRSLDLPTWTLMKLVQNPKGPKLPVDENGYLDLDHKFISEFAGMEYFTHYDNVEISRLNTLANLLLDKNSQFNYSILEDGRILDLEQAMKNWMVIDIENTWFYPPSQLDSKTMAPGVINDIGAIPLTNPGYWYANARHTDKSEYEKLFAIKDSYEARFWRPELEKIKRTFEELAKNFESYAHSAIGKKNPITMVAQNAGFDWTHMEYLIKSTGIDVEISPDILDTYTMSVEFAQRKFGGLPGIKFGKDDATAYFGLTKEAVPHWGLNGTISEAELLGVLMYDNKNKFLPTRVPSMKKAYGL